MTPITDIFIKTCDRDAAYLEYTKKSIEKFCSGFRNVVIVGGEHPRGYLHQQTVKLHADEFCEGADFVLITDSDTLFTRPVTPETYLRDGKAVWLHTPFTPEMLENSGVRAWHHCMQAFFVHEPPSEFMRRQPFMVPTWLLRGLREWCKELHGVSITDYVMTQNAFSEFNIMGFYAWLHRREDMAWVNTEIDPLPELTVRQFWSHDPIEKNLPEIQQILAQ